MLVLNTMPEGPSIVLLHEQVEAFEGKKILEVSGNTKIDQSRLLNKKVHFRTWGKHFLLCFKGFTVRVHFLLFGSYRINERKETPVRLSLRFRNGELNFYSAAILLVEQEADEIYEWSADVMNDDWDAKAARKKLKAVPEMMVCDALLEQPIFSGVGNIIKNEVLYRQRVHPETLVGNIPPRKLTSIINDARDYSFLFLDWKREFVLKKHFQAHTKKKCANCKGDLTKKYTGQKQRRSFFCENCQVYYY